MAFRRVDAMQPDALARMVAEDRATGRVPFLVVATSGTTSSMAFDPVPGIADVAHAEGLWLHVDSAMAGIAALCPELRFVNAGLDRADSYCTTKGLRQAVSNITTNTDGSKTVIFQCAPA